MRTLLGALAALVLIVSAACGGSEQHVRRCPDSPQVPCLTGEDCTIDSARGCQICRCGEAYGVHEQQQDPIGPTSPAEPPQ